MSSFTFQCCFCGLSITDSAAEPVTMTVEVGDGGVQALYCHVACLRRILHPSVPVAWPPELAERVNDFETAAERI